MCSGRAFYLHYLRLFFLVISFCLSLILTTSFEPSSDFLFFPPCFQRRFPTAFYLFRAYFHPSSTPVYRVMTSPDVSSLCLRYTPEQFLTTRYMAYSFQLFPCLSLSEGVRAPMRSLPLLVSSACHLSRSRFPRKHRAGSFNSA